MQRNYPVAKVASRANKVPIATSLSPAPMGAPSNSGIGWNHLNALSTHKKSEVSPDNISGKL